MISSNVHSESSVSYPPSFTIYPSHQKTPRCLWNSCYDGQAQCEREGQDQKAEMLDEILDTRLHKTKWQKKQNTGQLKGIFWQQKIMSKKLWDRLGSMDAYCTISGCLFLHISTPFEFDQGATLMTNTKPGRKSPHPLLSGNSAFVSFMRKK